MRVIEEMKAFNRSDYRKLSEPLRWCMHGGPGTGKSHALKILKEELFEGLLQWDMSEQFQIVAYQAVIADIRW